MCLLIKYDCHILQFDASELTFIFTAQDDTVIPVHTTKSTTTTPITSTQGTVKKIIFHCSEFYWILSRPC